MGKLTQQDVLDFAEAQGTLAKAKKVELELRKKIISHFRYGDKLEGVQHKSLDGLDMDILVTLKLTRSLDTDALDALWSELTEDQRACVEYKPSLNLKNYRALLLNGDEGELINIVTEKPALPSVVLKYEE